MYIELVKICWTTYSILSNTLYFPIVLVIWIRIERTGGPEPPDTSFWKVECRTARECGKLECRGCMGRSYSSYRSEQNNSDRYAVVGFLLLQKLL